MRLLQSMLLVALLQAIGLAQTNCALYTTIQNCLAAVPAAGGEALVPAGTYFSVTSTAYVGSATGGPVVLHIMDGAQLTINITSGADAIELFNGSMLKCDRGNATDATAHIYMGNNAKVNNVIMNAQYQSFAAVEGCFIFDPLTSNAIVGNVIYFSGLGAPSYIRDTIIYDFPAPQITITNTVGHAGGVGFLENVWSDCNSQTNCYPLRILAADGVSGHGSPGNIQIIGGAYTWPGAGIPIILINGQPPNTPSAITIVGVYLEGSHTNIGLQIHDAHDIQIIGLSGAGDANTDLVELEGVTSATYNIRAMGVTNEIANANNWKNTIYDAIEGIPYTQFSISDYTYRGTSIVYP